MKVVGLIVNFLTIISLFFGSITAVVAATYSQSARVDVVIGSGPANACNTLLKFTGSWSETEKTNVITVCKELFTAPSFANLLIAAGSVTLERVSRGSLGAGVCGYVINNTIKIACNMGDLSFAQYVISHELGHVIANYNGSLFNGFLNSGAYATEGLVPTYQFPGSGAGESFAEMIADYVYSKSYNFPARSWSGYPGGPWLNPGPSWTTFKDQYPMHYNFAKDNIFGRKEF